MNENEFRLYDENPVTVDSSEVLELLNLESDSPELRDAPDAESEALWRVERDSNRSPDERFAAHTARMEIVGDTLGWFLVACLALLTMPGAFTVGIAVTAFAVIMLAIIAVIRLVSLASM